MLICGLDIETTGLLRGNNEKDHRIIEICMIVYDSVTREKKLTYTRRINPHRSIDAKAYEVHKINLADLIKCDDFSHVADSIIKILSRCDLAFAHNGEGFDFPFIVHELIRVGKTVPNFNVFDTMLKGRWATADGKVPSLRELSYSLDIEYDTEKAHGAEYDVSQMADCLFKGIDLGFYKNKINCY